jgi:hypothetical protein
MDYNFAQWKERVDDLIKVIDDPDEAEILERAQEALAIQQQPTAEDQIAVTRLWEQYNYGMDAADVEEDEGD